MTPEGRDRLIRAEAAERDENLAGFRRLLLLLVACLVVVGGIAWISAIADSDDLGALVAVAGVVLLAIVAVVVSPRGDR